MGKLTRITENTLVPVSFLAIFAGMVIWLTTINNNVQASFATLSDIQKDQIEYRKNMQEVRERLIRIEGQLQNVKTR